MVVSILILKGENENVLKGILKLGYNELEDQTPRISPLEIDTNGIEPFSNYLIKKGLCFMNQENKGYALFLNRIHEYLRSKFRSFHYMNEYKFY